MQPTAYLYYNEKDRLLQASKLVNDQAGDSRNSGRLDFGSLKEQQEGRIPPVAMARAEFCYHSLPNFKFASWLSLTPTLGQRNPSKRDWEVAEVADSTTESFSQNSRRVLLEQVPLELNCKKIISLALSIT